MAKIEPELSEEVKEMFLTLYIVGSTLGTSMLLAYTQTYHGGFMPGVFESKSAQWMMFSLLMLPIGFLFTAALWIIGEKLIKYVR